MSENLEYQEYYNEKFFQSESAISNIAETLNNLARFSEELLVRGDEATPFSENELESLSSALFDGSTILTSMGMFFENADSQEMLSQPMNSLNEFSSLQESVYSLYDSLIPILSTLSGKESEFGGYLRSSLDILKGSFGNLFEGVNGSLKGLVALNESTLVESRKKSQHNIYI